MGILNSLSNIGIDLFLLLWWVFCFPWIFLFCGQILKEVGDSKKRHSKVPCLYKRFQLGGHIHLIWPMKQGKQHTSIAVSWTTGLMPWGTMYRFGALCEGRMGRLEPSCETNTAKSMPPFGSSKQCLELLTSVLIGYSEKNVWVRTQ